MRTRRILVLAIVGTVATHGQAQVADHLKCYSVKDPAVKALYTADLGGLVPEPGCQIKVPAKMVCVPTPKTNVSPLPPENVVGQPATLVVCYKVKCAKATLPPVPVADQFGARTLTAKTAKLLCAPVPVVPTTTTSTSVAVSSTTSTSTSTPTSTTATTLVAFTCGGSSPGTCPSPYLCTPTNFQLTNFTCAVTVDSCALCPAGSECTVTLPFCLLSACGAFPTCGSPCPAGSTCTAALFNGSGACRCLPD